MVDVVRGEDGLGELPPGVGHGPRWAGVPTFECLRCTGQFWRDSSLKRTLEHMEKAHGVMLGAREIASPILGPDGRPIVKMVPGPMFQSQMEVGYGN